MDYMPVALPAPPDSVDYGNRVEDWGMLLNNKIGDCTIAAWAHMLMLRVALGGQGKLWSDQDVLDAYIAVTAKETGAYNPDTGANDNGCVELDVLNWLRHDDQIKAYVSMDGRNVELVKFAIYAFAGVYMGAALPLTCQSQDVWDISDYAMTGEAAAGSWGGHAMVAVSYDADTVTFVTWGKLKQATWAWWRAYTAPMAGGECYAIISPDLFGGSEKAPTGFDIDQLAADIKALGTVIAPLEVHQPVETTAEELDPSEGAEEAQKPSEGTEDGPDRTEHPAPEES
jgi:hypothetical protein